MLQERDGGLLDSPLTKFQNASNVKSFYFKMLWMCLRSEKINNSADVQTQQNGCSRKKSNNWEWLYFHCHTLTPIRMYIWNLLTNVDSDSASKQSYITNSPIQVNMPLHIYSTFGRIIVNLSSIFRGNAQKIATNESLLYNDIW